VFVVVCHLSWWTTFAKQTPDRRQYWTEEGQCYELVIHVSTSLVIPYHTKRSLTSESVLSRPWCPISSWSEVMTVAIQVSGRTSCLTSSPLVLITLYSIWWPIQITWTIWKEYFQYQHRIRKGHRQLTTCSTLCTVFVVVCHLSWWTTFALYSIPSISLNFSKLLMNHVLSGFISSCSFFGFWCSSTQYAHSLYVERNQPTREQHLSTSSHLNHWNWYAWIIYHLRDPKADMRTSLS
jgi:hypothetical protein